MDKSIFLKWKKMSDDLKVLKEAEAALRREICSELFNHRQGNFKEVRETEEMRVVATSKVTRALDERVLQQLMGSLSDSEKACIKYTPSLIAANYKVLPKTSLLHEAITEKPAMPVLSVEILQ